MNKLIVHISDIHLKYNFDEDQTPVINEFFSDLSSSLPKDTDNYLFVTGDLVQEASDISLYELFIETFSERLDELGLTKDKRLCVPGNHDVCKDEVTKIQVIHEGIVSQDLDETAFNNFVGNLDKCIEEKFTSFLAFADDFCSYTVSDSLAGQGHMIDGTLGVYCLNTALLSSASLVSDEKRLSIETRKMVNWCESHGDVPKILVMHHPVSWLRQWAAEELELIIESYFLVCMFGHTHKQKITNFLPNSKAVVLCSAPPLLTNKRGKLGYSLLYLNSKNEPEKIKYREWSNRRCFVNGVNFTGTDEGEFTFINQQQLAYSSSAIANHLKSNLSDSLMVFQTSEFAWIEPIIKDIPETSGELEVKNAKDISIEKLISDKDNLIIKSAPQFGLSTLAHYLCNKAFSDKGKIWIYVDAESGRPDVVVKFLKRRLIKLGITLEDISTIVLDNWDSRSRLSEKIINAAHAEAGSRIIVMESVSDIHFSNGDASCDEENERCNIRFSRYFLWSLSKQKIRNLVEGRNSLTQKFIADDDAMVNRILADLVDLNFSRTPLNCISLIKAFEAKFDEHPVNRSEVMERLLFLIFNYEVFPLYGTQPDLKDCQFVIGFFCEHLLRTRNTMFSKSDFLDMVNQFCAEKLIEVDLGFLFKMLFENNIIVQREDIFSFRFANWVLYFAALRMDHDSEFKEWIFEDQRYLSYPLIIEYFTGIKRNCSDELVMLSDGFSKVYETLNAKFGDRGEFDVYGSLYWKADDNSAEKIQEDIVDIVHASNLPTEVKDAYTDRAYNRALPYNQEISVINSELLPMLINSMACCAKALRNSDYASPAIKKNMLSMIVNGSELIGKVLFVHSNTLSRDRSAVFEGLRIVLAEGFQGPPEKIVEQIIRIIPQFVNTYFANDLYSPKMSKLLIDQIEDEGSGFKKHQLMRVVVAKLPANWDVVVDNYVQERDKNDYYLMDIFNALVREYKYSYASKRDIEKLGNLLKKIGLVHGLIHTKSVKGKRTNRGVKNPGAVAISKVPKNFLPVRVIDDD